MYQITKDLLELMQNTNSEEKDSQSHGKKLKNLTSKAINQLLELTNMLIGLRKKEQNSLVIPQMKTELRTIKKLMKV